MESPLPHDVVELIMERLPVKSLMRSKAVSKQWQTTIESTFFKERQLKHRQQSGDPDVLMVSVCSKPPQKELLRTLVLGSSSSVRIPTPWEKENLHYFVSYNSCDGMVCLYHPVKSGFVVNPTTGWYRPLPVSGLQQLIIDLGDSYFELGYARTHYMLGFGKDIITGTYKAVWLYNSSELGLENATTCEVFDFTTSSWRYVTPASPYPVVGCTDPVFVDGSLHWLTVCEETTHLVSFDLHTEAFQVICKAPFASSDFVDILVCNLDNRLCVSEKKWPDQVIWSFDSGNKTWVKMFSIDLPITVFLYDLSPRCAFPPLALLDGGKKKKKKLLFYGRVKNRSLLTLDPETQSDDVAFSAESIGTPVCYFPSLFSIE
ncbi:unnamed protein product [Microthlaspi erraticum]|uniref:F-box domain-containing protein n=1 Tax=Microthlaspi erraticum TaxID=1685480 RepID=A0A6D2IRX5_9BRAS|nr:unnamed protein product [Microthlaspi erraticum]